MSNIKQIVNSGICVGCGCCAAICPTKSIVLEEKSGFYTPAIVEKDCIHCGKCEKVCAIIDEKMQFNIAFEWYAGYADKKNMHPMSTSGGICTLLSDIYLEAGKSVYAASFDEDWRLRHRRIESIEQLEKFAGSKYLQSFVSTDVYQEIADKLKSGEECLFIGTPCQVAGIIEYMKFRKFDINKLITIDFLCHGVPSPVLGKKYLKYLEHQTGRKIISYNFRSKAHGWGKLYRSVTFEGKSERVVNCGECPLHTWFGKHYSIRKSCFSCRYRRKERVSDITVADFWGLNKYYPEIETKQGVSAIQINTLKGKRIYSNLLSSGHIISYEVSDKSMWDRKTATVNFPIPVEYDTFWKNAETLPINQLIEKFPSESKMDRNMARLKNLFKRVSRIFD